MSTPLTFTISEGFEDDSDYPVQYGTFSRDWDDEKELDALMDRVDSGSISPKQAILQAPKLLRQPHVGFGNARRGGRGLGQGF